MDLRRRIGYATQRPGLLSTSVIATSSFPCAGEASTRRAGGAAQTALERLNVAQLADRKALSLSGGEAQRVSLARALAIEPGLLLLDEPAAGLDAEARRAFFDDLERALNDRTTTVVHVSHRAEEALRLADRVAVLTGGTLRQLGMPRRWCGCRWTAPSPAWSGTRTSFPSRSTRPGRSCRRRALRRLRYDGAGPATLATWATAIGLTPCQADATLNATVERASQGPGRWEVTLQTPPKPSART